MSVIQSASKWEFLLRLGLNSANAEHQAMYWLMKVGRKASEDVFWTEDVRTNQYEGTTKGFGAIVQHYARSIET